MKNRWKLIGKEGIVGFKFYLFIGKKGLFFFSSVLFFWDILL